MNNIPLLVAFSAGLLSFVSPCVLPLIPAYIGYLTGMTNEQMAENKSKIKISYKAAGFILGFSIVFIALGASATSLGRLLIQHQLIFRKLAGLLIIIFGIHTSGIFKIKFLYYEKKLLSFNKASGKLGPIIMGIAFAFGWTPCVGPILSAILLYAGSLHTVSKGILLLTAYSIGMAVPFMITAVAMNSLLNKIKKFSKYLPAVSILSGILMIILGIFIFTNKLGIISSYFNFINF
ncbi:MAG: cytochrome c biogenesis protein CcdA [Bacillota bacterium]|nr:cytochrome c biogenesis protein CcdA [Bacillota bacterium]